MSDTLRLRDLMPERRAHGGTLASVTVNEARHWSTSRVPDEGCSTNQRSGIELNRRGYRACCGPGPLKQEAGLDKAVAKQSLLALAACLYVGRWSLPRLLRPLVSDV